MKVSLESSSQVDDAHENFESSIDINDVKLDYFE